MPAEYSASPTEKSYNDIHIGSLHIEGNLFFAPMAGYTDRVTRALAYACGADLCFTEMISCEGIIRGNSKTQELLKPWQPIDVRAFCTDKAARQFFSTFEEKQLFIQVFTASPDSAGKAAALLTRENPAVIDLNCGCPMPKVCKTGAGAALMEYPGKIKEIIKRIKGEGGCPVTLKIRSGADNNSITYPKAVEAAISGGAAAISIHPRTIEQRYSGRASWDHLRHTVEIAGTDIPVIGSGDLKTPEDAREMLKQTGCAGVMFARGAVGNPSIFGAARKLFGSRPARVQLPPVELAALHLNLALLEYGEKTGRTIMKKHLAAFLRHLPGGADRRKDILTAETSSHILSVLSSLS